MGEREGMTKQEAMREAAAGRKRAGYRFRYKVVKLSSGEYAVLATQKRGR